MCLTEIENLSIISPFVPRIAVCALYILLKTIKIKKDERYSLYKIYLLLFTTILRPERDSHVPFNGTINLRSAKKKKKVKTRKSTVTTTN